MRAMRGRGFESFEPQYACIERSCREDENGLSNPRGMVTYPERFDADVLREYEATLGPYFFSTLMLNRPVSIGDMLFRAEWFQEYETLPPRQSLSVFTTIDPATDPELAPVAAIRLLDGRQVSVDAVEEDLVPRAAGLGERLEAWVQLQVVIRGREWLK